jgi:hypothetical protein
VHLGSTNPLDPPHINPRFFSNSVDLDVFARGVDFTLRLWESEALKGAVKEMVAPNNVPEATWTRPDVRVGAGIGYADTKRLEAIKEFIKERANAVFHAVGTSAMLPRDDGGVVDSELKVYGTGNIRVVCSFSWHGVFLTIKMLIGGCVNPAYRKSSTLLTTECLTTTNVTGIIDSHPIGCICHSREGANCLLFAKEL